MTGRPDTVYFMKPIGHDGPIKIGCSSVPYGRLADLAVWSPFPLEIVATASGSYSDEAFLHRCFADTRAHGEWFHFSARLAQTVAEIARTGTLDSAKANLRPTGSAKPAFRIRTADQKLFMSYTHRIRWALTKLRTETDCEIVYRQAPSEITAIMDRWFGNKRKGIPRRPPSSEEFRRLEDFLASPNSQASTHRVSRLRRIPATPPVKAVVA